MLYIHIFTQYDYFKHEWILYDIFNICNIYAHSLHNILIFNMNGFYTRYLIYDIYTHILHNILTCTMNGFDIMYIYIYIYYITYKHISYTIYLFSTWMDFI